MDWTDLEDRLAHAIGLDAKSLGSTVFRLAVGRRMRARDVETLPIYIRLVDSDSDEFQSLVEELVVRESWFFRHAHSFELLQQHAVSTMAGHRDPYRVLSFPCAGAEEPYSIVISLREAGLGFDQFQVHAADISETALQKARGGRYSLRSIRVVPHAIKDRYFRVNSDSVEVVPEIRQAVHFTKANIVEVQGLLRGTVYDAVFCRNLLIYLTPEARQRVIKEVDQWLSPSGLFFVGHAEMLRELEELFEPVRERSAFAYSHRSRAKATSIMPPLPLGEGRGEGLDKGVGSLFSRPGIFQPYENDPAAAKKDSRPRLPKGEGTTQPIRDEWVQTVSELANASRHKEAIDVCEQQLRKNGPNSKVYHTLGMVYQAAGLMENAEQALERAVYLDPHHEEALLALALLARRRGAIQIADRLEQRSQRAHDRSLRS